jgi:uncharacterized protein
MAMNLVKLIPYGQLGLLRVDNLMVIILLSPLAYLGVKIGVELNRRFDEVWFNRVIYIVLALTGVQLIAGRSIIAMFF